MRRRFFRWLAGVSVRHPWRILAGVLVVFLAGAALASTLTPRLTWMDMLPQDEPSAQEFSNIMEEFGSFEVVLVSVEGPDPDRLVSFAQAFSSRVATLADSEGTELVKRVTWREDVDFLEDHGLLLTEQEDLERMLETGLFDEPGLLPTVEAYNGVFESEFIRTGEQDLASMEAEATRAIDTQWFLPRTLRWFLENQDRSASSLRAKVEEGARRFARGDARYFSDDRSMLLIMVQPSFSTNETMRSLVMVQRTRDIFEELLSEYPEIAENYAGPWPVTSMWKALAPHYEDDPAGLEALRMQVPYKAPAIAGPGDLDAGTGMTGMHVYMNDEYMTMFHDMGLANVVVFVAVLVLFVAAFRMWASPVMAMVVLGVSITIGMGAVALTLGELTMMAMMFPVILLGLGVDYFIHLLGEYTQRRGQGESAEPALCATLDKTGPGILTGGLTTALAFLALGLASFRGISDLGISAGLGVLCTLATSFVVLPPLLVLVYRWRTRREARREARGHPPRKRRNPALEFRFLGATGELAWRLWPVTLLVTIGLTVFMATRAGQVRWAKDMLSIEAEHLASLELNEVLEERFYIHPDSVVVSADSLEQSHRFTEQLEDLSTVRMVDSISNLLPPPREQQARAELVREIRHRLHAWEDPEPFDEARAQRFLESLYQMDCNVITLRKSAYMSGLDRLYAKADDIVPEGETCIERTPGEPRPPGGWPRVAASGDVKAIAAWFEAHPDQAVERLNRFQSWWHPALEQVLTSMADPSPLSLSDLPRSARDRYVSTDGGSFLVTAYPSGDVWNEEFQERLFPDLFSVSERFTGTPVLFVDTVERGAREGKRSTLYALTAILVLVVLDFWGFRRSGRAFGRGVVAGVLSLTPLLVGAVWMVGSMSLLDIELNMVNVIAVPLLLGIGIDDGVHVIHRYRAEGPGEIRTVLLTVGRAILITSLTTIAAFGSFALGLYQGLVSTGIILAIGIAICFLLSAYLLPALLHLAELLGVRP